MKILDFLSVKHKIVMAMNPNYQIFPLTFLFNNLTMRDLSSTHFIPKKTKIMEMYK